MDLQSRVPQSTAIICIWTTIYLPIPVEFVILPLAYPLCFVPFSFFPTSNPVPSALNPTKTPRLAVLRNLAAAGEQRQVAGALLGEVGGEEEAQATSSAADGVARLA